MDLTLRYTSLALCSLWLPVLLFCQWDGFGLNVHITLLFVICACSDAPPCKDTATSSALEGDKGAVAHSALPEESNEAAAAAATQHQDASSAGNATSA